MLSPTILAVNVTCGNMPDVANAVGTPNPGDNGQVDPGETGSYECNANFAPRGNSIITCNNVSGVVVWETPTFNCTRKYPFSFYIHFVYSRMTICYF